MTPERVSKTGTYRIQMRVVGVGRIAVSSGAKTVTEYRKRKACLVNLRDTGRLDILRAIKHQQLTVNEVYAAHMAGRLGFVMADIVLQRPLRESIEKWLKTVGKAKATRTRYKVAWNVLKKRVNRRAAIKDLDAVEWRVWSNTWTASSSHWNHLRRMVSKFLSDQIGKHNPFRHEIMEMIPRKKEVGRVPDLSVDDFWRIVNTLPEHYRSVYVTLVATLMRINELLACSDLHLRHHSKAIAVPGTKTASSEATIPVDGELWPHVRAAIPCPFSHWQLWRKWRDACIECGIHPTTLHDLRHVGAQWLKDAGMSEASIQAMLRHDSPAQTRVYTATVLKREDAAAMAKILRQA